MEQEVEVSFNLRGRKWTNPEGETKYFTSLQAWRIASLAKEGAEPIAQKDTVQQATEEGTSAVDGDDLPF